MARTREWLQRHGWKLLLLIGLLLLANGIAGHLNGIKTGLAPDGRYPGKIYQTPVWFLDIVGVLIMASGIAMVCKQARKNSLNE